MKVFTDPNKIEEAIEYQADIWQLNHHDPITLLRRLQCGLIHFGYAVIRVIPAETFKYGRVLTARVTGTSETLSVVYREEATKEEWRSFYGFLDTLFPELAGSVPELGPGETCSYIKVVAE